MFNTTKQGKLAPITDQLLLTPAHKLSMMVKEGSVSLTGGARSARAAAADPLQEAQEAPMGTGARARGASRRNQ